MYLFKQKFQVSDLVELAHSVMRVLLVEPEEDLAGVYGRHFRQRDYHVLHRSGPENLIEDIARYRPHILILNVGVYAVPRAAVADIRRLRGEFPRLPVITVAFQLDPEVLKDHMNAGITGHLDRRHSRPADLVALAEALTAKNL
jgi:DNA-binding NarL/FixJ family response regulator